MNDSVATHSTAGAIFSDTLILSVGFVLFTTLATLFATRRRESFPTLNDKNFLEFSDKRVKTNFVINGRKLLRDGLKRFKNQPFRVLTDHGPTLIFPPCFAQELRNMENLSHVKAVGSVSL
jgi:hypothetical protein